MAGLEVCKRGCKIQFHFVLAFGVVVQVWEMAGKFEASPLSPQASRYTYLNST